MPDGGIVAACETPIPVQSLPGTPCLYQIPPPPCDYVDSFDIQVIADGTTIPHDVTHTGGWDYADVNGGTIQIYGPSCDAITAGTATAVSIKFIISGIASVTRR